MIRKLFFGSIWLALVAYAIASSFFRTQQGVLDLIINLSIGNWEGINPIIIAIFYIMGIFPLVYGALILFDRQQNISPYAFFAVSFGVGAFALLPYFALRQPDTTWDGQKNWLLKILDSRLMAIISSTTIVGLLTWGLIQGDWTDFATQWQTNQFVHVMSLDFCLLCVLFPAILRDDLQRRGAASDKWFWLVALVPLFGGLAYWCVRPQLPETTVTAQSINS
ncbi:DUF2834 domain-containing protein [Pleurocapsales cyanobacterium LEGE 10410]|nr:DUF2834 domain-containing protein [Pleurocapsales cyanobacterium LEGE 10410]